MRRSSWVVVLVCLSVMVAGVVAWSASRDPLRGQVEAIVQASFDGGEPARLGPLMRQQDASALVVVCPYAPLATVAADTGIDVAQTSNERDEASVDLVFASGSEVRGTVTLPTGRYDLCSDLGDYDVVPVFGPNVALSAREGDASTGGAEILVSLVQ